LPATSHHLLLSPTGARLYVATRDGGSVLEVNPSTLLVLRTFPLSGRTQAMTFSPDGHTLYVANELAAVVHAIDLTSGTSRGSTPLAGGVNGIALSPDGSRIVASIIFVGDVQVLDRATLTIDTTFVTGGDPACRRARQGARPGLGGERGRLGRRDSLSRTLGLQSDCVTLAYRSSQRCTIARQLNRSRSRA
jgi:DNA-binding beta-propeller fold protein YncE